MEKAPVMVMSQDLPLPPVAAKDVEEHGVEEQIDDKHKDSVSELVMKKNGDVEV